MLRLACLWLLLAGSALPAQAQDALEVYELNYSRGAIAFGQGQKAPKLRQSPREAKRAHNKPTAPPVKVDTAKS